MRSRLEWSPLAQARRQWAAPGQSLPIPCLEALRFPDEGLAVSGRTGLRLRRAMLDFEHAKRSYYTGGLSLLRYLEARAPTQRRFGAQADAAWSQFRGDLTTADRIQLMLADAHAQWPGSVGASAVFSAPGVVADDAFGADWAPLSGMVAEQLWRAIVGAPSPDSPGSALAAVARAWGLEFEPMEPPAVAPGQRWVVAGPSAVAALIAPFAQAPDLNWGRQVWVVATPPGHRQVAAAAGPLLNLSAGEPVRLLTATEAVGKGALRDGAQAFVSDDAATEDADAARRAGAGK
jgi:hypothetical protein